ncbi:hypothetical protein QMG83_05755 [Salinibacterium sp. G-O1]|uniref:hypothetical protein n=1 Tax=Salinibacterium sp. G-O1 TaxID=3046208 RepID=UPI0024BBE47E|nr:hypothetical protein [Salinibacterium sp. G-O1]MDJ0334724.1 hypothetical protein [Salinibacterium sp. G-O1]
MPGDSEFFPPVQYLPWWGIIGFVLLVVIVGWYVFLFLSTRAGRVPPPPPTEAAQWLSRTTETVRMEYLQLIDQTRRAHASGAMDSREAHHQLSQIVRSFVAEREGQQTMQMTLKDLRATRFTPLTKAVEKLYPGAFGAGTVASVDKAVDEAKRLVSRWH